MSHILWGHQRRWGRWATTGLSPLGWGHRGHQATMCLSLLIQGDDQVPRPLGTLGTSSHNVSQSLQLRQRPRGRWGRRAVTGLSPFRWCPHPSGTLGDIEPCWVLVPQVTAVTRGTLSCEESRSLGLGDIALRRISMSWVGDVGDIGDIEDVGDTGDVRGTGGAGDIGDSEPQCVSVLQVGDTGDTRDVRP